MHLAGRRTGLLSGSHERPRPPQGALALTGRRVPVPWIGRRIAAGVVAPRI